MNVAESSEIGGGGGGNREDETVEKSQCSKNSNRTTHYLTPNARQAFTQLRQTFTEALILQHFDPKCHI